VDISDTTVKVIIGLGGVVIGSMISPWVKWRVERNKLIHKERHNRVENWRTFIEKFDFDNKNFVNTAAFSAMRPYMDPEVIKNFESQSTAHVPQDVGSGYNVFKQWASEQVSKIEKDWKLI
jgi:hypothetical protein